MKYKFKFLTESDETKLHSLLTKKNVKYDYNVNLLKKEEVFIFEETLARSIRCLLENQGGEMIKEDDVKDEENIEIEETPKEISKTDTLVEELFPWIELEVSKEQIQSVLWAIAQLNADEEVLEVIGQIRKEEEKSFYDTHPDFKEEEDDE